jgi:hypothetical protein
MFAEMRSFRNGIALVIEFALMRECSGFVAGGYQVGHRLGNQPDQSSFRKQARKVIYCKTTQFVARCKHQHLGSRIVKHGRNA